jgi:hypothetical protein
MATGVYGYMNCIVVTLRLALRSERFERCNGTKLKGKFSELREGDTVRLQKCIIQKWNCMAGVPKYFLLGDHFWVGLWVGLKGPRSRP